MILRLTLFLLATCVASLAAADDDYRAEPTDAAPPTDEISPAVAKQLGDSGFKVVTSQGRTLCEIWPAKAWTVAADFKPSGGVVYPFKFGELIGVVRYARKAGDFRGQSIRKGTYTMRYGLQPQDGNHIGTSDTRDFVVLIPAADDSEAQPLEKEPLFKESKKASKTTHPAILSMLPAGGEGEALPRMVHHELRELWAVDFAGQAAGGKGKPVVVELVVVGHVPE
ncbi:MAG TPA: hypothetical protein VFW87_08320 [Pirellulales bacterium]|nr:hypothetical protein [Pirellulales bacterium]